MAQNKETGNTEEKLNIGLLFSDMLKYWYWYLISFIIIFTLAFVYLGRKNPQWDVQTYIMLNQDDESSSGTVVGLDALMSTFSMGGGGGANMEDELIKLKSKTLMEDVVKRLNLTTRYWSRDNFFSQMTIYYNDSPLEITLAKEVADTLSKPFNFHITTNGVTGSIKVLNARKKELISKDFQKLPFKVKVPNGPEFTISATSHIIVGEKLNFYAQITSLSLAANLLREEISIDKVNRRANAIEILITDACIPRAEDILNTLVKIYNENSIIDRRESAANATRFIEERLIKLYKELESSETNIENYKIANQIVDATAEAEYIFKKKETIEGAMVELETKASVLGMIKDYLLNSENKYSLVPFTESVPEAPISAYNELLLERMRMESNAKGNNAALRQITSQIDAMRKNIITTLDRQIASTHIALKDMGREAGQSENRINGIPTMERELRALYRDQLIKNEIYGFLLQKREENELKMARNSEIGKVIDIAYPSDKPVSPKPLIIYAVALILSFALPSTSLYYKNRKKYITAD